MEFRFPQGFSLGVSSAATQIEGGDCHSSWNDWYDKGHISDGSDPVDSRHWQCWQEDADLMAAMGIRQYRLGLEWARIVPQRGQVDEAAVAQYRAELSYLLELGIHPLLTLHHFTNPMWFEEKGAFTRRENLEDFLDFVRLAAERFGDLVSDYVTINEPNVYALSGYGVGQWPPGHHSYREMFLVLENMAYCHIRAYDILHSVRRKMGYDNTMVGFANHVRVFAPENPRNPLHCLYAKAGRWLFQGAITHAMARGDFRLPLRNWARLPQGEYADFTGVNYYTRSTLSGLCDGVAAHTPRNDLGWEIYPQGLIECTRELQSVLPRPVWVTENGTCDNTDSFRSRYICEHLKAICDSDLPFQRYYHWCFGDNFEWVEGFSARFGLVRAEAGSTVRAVKRSGELYAQLIRDGGLTEETWQRYAAGEEYTIE